MSGSLEFNPYECFVDGSETTGYCIGNLILTLACVFVTVACILLFVWHMNRNGWCEVKTYTDEATYVFIFLMLFNIINLARYLLTIYEFSWYIVFVNFNEMIQSLLQYQVCNIFVQRSINKNKSVFWVKTFLNILLLVILCVYVTFGVLASEGLKELTCKSILFVLTGDVQILIIFMFICFAFYIDKKAKLFIEEK